MSYTMLLYKNVVALSRDDHFNLKLQGTDNYEFASHVHWLPVSGKEFFMVAKSYPIVFVSEGEGADEKVTAIVLTGLEKGMNAYVQDDMRWRPDVYIPAFIRRYPFVLATSDTEENELMVCFDAGYAGFNEYEGRPLFDENGNETELLTGAVQFMGEYNNDLMQTRQFVEELHSLGLLEKRSVEIRGAGGATFQINDIMVVSEEKFAALSAEEVKRMQLNGSLGWIYAHFMSLSNLPVLLDLHLQKKGAAPAA